MKILVTGAKGFIGKNLVVALKQLTDNEVFEHDIDSTVGVLKSYLAAADFVFHLAGVNRPEKVEEFQSGNTGFTERICAQLLASGRKTPLVFLSSTQAELKNPYGDSKKAAEDIVFAYGRESGAPVFVYRMPNVFGKWCRPNYNSAVATFCHNIARDLPIQVRDPNVEINLVYIDDVVSSLVSLTVGPPTVISGPFCAVQPVYAVKLGDIAALIYSFRESRALRTIPDMSDPFTKKLYATYLSYLPVDRFSYPLTMNVDERGSFTEFIRTVDRGQVSINISRPGITKGNHWHHTKNEKFLVVSGQGVIRLRRIGSKEVIKYEVSGEKLEVVDIPTGYTHNITNTGTTDLVTVMWCSELFDEGNPDTILEPV